MNPPLESICPVIVIGLDALVPAILEKYIHQGRLPNFKRLMDAGSYTRAQALFPGVTPVNWATISTGAMPGTHGINDFGVIEPGDELNTSRNGFKAETYRAQTLWQAVCEAGFHAATLNFPGGDARQHANHLWIAGRGSPAAVTHYAIRNVSCIASSKLGMRMIGALIAEQNGNEFRFQLDPEYLPGEGPLLHFHLKADSSGRKGLEITSEHTVPGSIFLLPGTSSPWLWTTFLIYGKSKKASLKLELTKFDETTREWAVVTSQINCPLDIANPPEIGERLVTEIGPFTAYSGSRALDHGWADGYHMVRMGEYKGMWQARAARTLVESLNFDLVMFKWHLIDHVQHSFWGGIDPLSPWYDKVDRTVHSEVILGSYQAADNMLGELLPLLHKGITLMVVSDHGHLPHIRAVNINNYLVEKGLISLLPGSENPPAVDWTRTRVYGSAALGHIRVNQQGRQPHGCVTMEDFEIVRQDLIDTLQELKDPITHHRVIEKTFRKEDAASMGQWGERTGDVVYWMTPGYSGDFHWAPLARDGEIFYNLTNSKHPFAEYGEGKYVASFFQSVHGAGDPSACLGEGTEEAVILAAGPTIKSGVRLKKTPQLTCVTPTISRATGLPLPAQSEGQPLEEWIK